MLEISDLRFGHGMQQMTADKLVLSPGIIGVIGASGSGKSTFLNVISGFHREDQGQIKFEGQDITAFRVEDRPVAMLFQSNNLFPHLSIFRNVALALTSRRWLSNNERLRIEDALSRVGLAGFYVQLLQVLMKGSEGVLIAMVLTDNGVATWLDLCL